MSTLKVNELDTKSGTTITVATGKTIAGTDIIDTAQIKASAVDTSEIAAGAVTNAKTDFQPGTIFKGDGSSADGKITLNCSQNTHGVSIQSPAHASAASYTLTLPTTDGNADEFMQTDGAGALTFAAVAGHTPIASQWRLTADVASGGQDPIDANLEVADQDGYGSLGAAMTEASGVFTFPSTGIWLVIYNWTFQPSNYSNDCSCWIDATIDSPTNTWVKQAKTWTSGGGASEIKKMSASATAIIDVTSVSTVKVQFGWSINLNGGTRVTYGDSTNQETGFTFVRLGDT